MEDTPLTAEDLATITARAAAATSGPWRWNRDNDIESATALDDRYPPQPADIIRTDSRVYPPCDADAAFIIAAREDVPRLVAEVRRLRSFEIFVRDLVHECPAHGQATVEYPCPPGCAWPEA